jgi:pimeloyl-ACP methyl ester carboxylesterase
MKVTPYRLPLRVERLGDSGDPIVLIHGFGATSFTWRYWAPELARDHRVFMVEPERFAPGEEPFPEYHTPEGQAGLIETLILQNDLKRVTLVGHSLGGGIALLTAIRLMDRGEDRLLGLVIVSGAAYPQRIPPAISIARIPLVGEAFLKVVPARWLIRLILRVICYDPNVVTRNQVEAYSEVLLTKEGRYGLVRLARKVIPEAADSLVRRFREIRVPTLLLWGRHDPVVKVGIGERLKEDLPDATLVVLEECGHVPPEEQPRESLAPVRSFIDRISRRGGEAPGEPAP